MPQQEETMSYLSFYQKYYGEVLRYLIRKCSSLSDAEDLTQDVFSYCWSHLEQYDARKASYRSWLYVIVLSRWKNHCRDTKGWSSVDDFEDILPMENGDVEAAVFLDEKRTLLAKAMADLPIRERDILILHFWGHKNSEQIAEIMQLKAANVRQLQKRALKKLKDMLAE